MNRFTLALNIARKQVRSIEDRGPEYQKQLIGLLTKIIAKQSEGLTQRRRRDEIESLVKRLGEEISATEGRTNDLA